MAAIVTYEDFDPTEDANALRKAMKGFGTDEEGIINVLARRSNAQRQEIAVAFYHEHGRELVKDLKSELGGKLEDIALGLMRTPASYDAYCLRKAMKGAGTDEDVLLEVLCTRTSAEIEDTKKAFFEEYKEDLVDAVKSEVRGDFERLLVALMETHRPKDDGNVDSEKVERDAHALLNAGEKKMLGTDEKKFIDILTSRSRAHLKEVFHQYASICDYDIEKSIEREMGGKLEKALIAIVNWVRGPEEWFAERLYKAMDGLGTDDKDLQRVIISRSEVDLKDIAEAFNKNHDRYDKTLQNWIRDDISGDYQTMMMTVLGYE